MDTNSILFDNHILWVLVIALAIIVVMIWRALRHNTTAYVEIPDDDDDRFDDGEVETFVYDPAPNPALYDTYEEYETAFDVYMDHSDSPDPNALVTKTHYHRLRQLFVAEQSATKSEKKVDDFEGVEIVGSLATSDAVLHEEIGKLNLTDAERSEAEEMAGPSDDSEEVNDPIAEIYNAIDPKSETPAVVRLGAAKGKLTDDEVRTIRKSSTDNFTLAVQHDVSVTTIRNVKARKTYQHVAD